MLPTSILLSLSALLPCMQDAAQSALEGTAPKRTHLPEAVVTMPLDLAHGWPVVEVHAGGLGPYRMILDTGSSVTVLHKRVQAELGIESTGTTRIGDPSNPTAREFDVIHVPELNIGDAFFEELTAVSWSDDMGLSSVGIDGIIGLPLFRDCLVTLDYPAQEVRIERGALPEADGERVIGFKGTDSITLTLEVAGAQVDAHFDSGNSRHITLPARLEEQLELVPGSEHTGNATRASGTFQVHGGKLNGAIRVGGRVLENPNILFDTTLPVANVGRTFLDQGAVTIDLKHGRMRVAPDAPRAAAPASMVQRRDLSPGGRKLGIEMMLGGGAELKISRVLPGSLGETSGLRAGDVLLTVNGEPVSAIEHQPLRDALAKPDAFAIAVRRGDARVVIDVPAE